MLTEPNGREEAVIRAFDDSKALVLELRLGLHEYWDDLHPVIDNDSFRRSRGIRTVRGWLFGCAGTLVQQFESAHDLEGAYRGGTATHEDGTVTADGTFAKEPPDAGAP